ncbi:MAG: carbohydrate kinase family protein [Oligoflexales bacterium]
MPVTITVVGDTGVDRYAGIGDYIGGCSFNVAAHISHLSKNDIRTQLISPLGDETLSQLILKKVEKLPLKAFFAFRSGPPPVQDIEIASDGEKIFTRYHPGVLEGYSLGAKEMSIIRESDYVVTVYYREIEQLFHSVFNSRPAGKLVVDFMNLRDYKKRLDPVDHLLKSVDIALFGLEHDDTDLIDQLKGRTLKKNQIILLTFGAAGSVCLHSGGLTAQPAAMVPKAVDTTGAGDSFLAAFLTQFAEGHGVAAAMEAASTYAAATVQYVGASQNSAL